MIVGSGVEEGRVSEGNMDELALLEPTFFLSAAGEGIYRR